MMRGSIVIKERPILFSAPMIRALLDGTKTQTRRLVNPQPIFDPPQIKDCKHGVVGDQLWAKETWQALWGVRDFESGIVEDFTFPEKIPKTNEGRWSVAYAADWPCPTESVEDRGFPWRPSIFMPRWASRISLEIAAIRVERLQDISEDDAKAEGVRPFFEVYDCFGPDQRICTGELARDFPYRASYACLWDEINGDRALWNTNPWVWVIDLKKLAATGS